MPQTARLHHVALGARDVETVAAFYRGALGLTERDRHLTADGDLRSIWLDLGDSILMIERTASPAREVEGVGAGPFLLALAVDPADRAAVEERLLAAGAPIEDRTEFTSYARDPEGNRVAISHWPAPAHAV
jgi:catechol 2,3-dioxygenase-like lactoylglutathione lyase family enzyme